VVVDIGLADGRRDMWIATDPTGKPQPISVGGDVRFTGDLAFVRRGADGTLQELAVYGGQSLAVGTWEFSFAPAAGFVELHLDKDDAFLRSGSKGAVVRIQRNGKSVRLRAQN
jgi:hypothetical protein